MRKYYHKPRDDRLQNDCLEGLGEGGHGGEEDVGSGGEEDLVR